MLANMCHLGTQKPAYSVVGDWSVWSITLLVYKGGVSERVHVQCVGFPTSAIILYV